MSFLFPIENSKIKGCLETLWNVSETQKFTTEYRNDVPNITDSLQMVRNCWLKIFVILEIMLPEKVPKQ